MGLVAPVEGPCARQGQDIANSERWIRDLQPRHIGEIDAALTEVENRGIGWSEITATDFPLPGLTDLTIRPFPGSGLTIDIAVPDDCEI